MTLGRRITAEAIGTALLLTAVIGSGIMGERSGPLKILLLYRETVRNEWRHFVTSVIRSESGYRRSIKATEMLTPENTYLALLIVQALHILHHRLAKRHISFAEVISAIVLCVPPWAPLPPRMFMGVHLSLIAVQIVGSLWIRKLSPEWSNIKT